MPWATFEQGDQFCVFKVTAEGEKDGETLGCHPSRKEAQGQVAALYAEEPEAKKGRLRQLWDGLCDLVAGEPPVKRAMIKETATWDGDPAGWTDAQSFCDSCLLNLNAAAGHTDRGEWQKGLCMLPVRGPGDSERILVAKALKMAAQSGRFDELHKPDAVSEEAWNDALRAAARTLLKGYVELGEDAPDHLYTLANRKPPEPEPAPAPEAQRALGIADVYAQVQAQLAVSQMAPADPNVPATPGQESYLVDLIMDEGAIAAIINQGGKLYKAAIGLAGTTVQMGTLSEVEATYAPAQRSAIQVQRQADGSLRWFALVSTNVLNRSGEIDSAALYRSLVDTFRQGDSPVLLDFYHEPNIILGAVDWLETDGHALVASGLLADNELARAYVDATTAGRGRWGCSISFEPTTEPQQMEIVKGVTIPVYETGVLRRIAVLPEAQAASWFTRIGLEVQRMKADVEAALVTLFGDEAKAKEFIASIDATNRAIDDKGLVTRQVIDEAKVREIVAQAIAAIPAAVAPVIPERVDLDPLNAAVVAHGARLAALEAAEQQRQTIRRADMPAQPQQTVTFRPRERRQAGAQNMAQLAEQTLAKMRGNTPQGAK